MPEKENLVLFIFLCILLCGCEKEYLLIQDAAVEEVLEIFDLSREMVRKNADYFEGSWEVAQYIIKEEELQLSAKEMKKAQEEYANENGYENTEDLLSDSGLQYVTEEIYIKVVKDFLYEQATERR